MAGAVPAILKYLSDSSNYNIDQNMETPVRAKKRRLDHLSWEEKLQRKKLKNRVAAQTSRDRKKAKMDQMEKAIEDLFAKNEIVLEECEKLRKMNERLSSENAELRHKLTSTCVQCSQSRTVECEAQSGSAARNGHTLSSGSETADHGPAEDCIGLPSLPDLLDELNNDVDISSLEQLTQSLLQDIARDLEAAAEKADIQESVARQENDPGQVVGTTPEQLESDGGDLLSRDRRQDPLTDDISQYLLLHHNYSAKPREEKRKSNRARLSTRTRPKPKEILPKIGTNKQHNMNKLASLLDLPIMKQQQDVIYGTYDENTNCITIVVEDDGLENESEALLEDAEDGNCLTVPTATERSASPHSSSVSDCGYESFGSPDTLAESDDIWDDSVSELFPNLM